ncbi:MAG: cyclic nucleotide-binding domain-containing protein [Bacteroidetes bacterium]|nr:cyclic nucleotide-binding domain-containing protein [Bacteroidota bacterium]
MNYTSAEAFAYDLLKKNLPANLYYHNLAHTIDVTESTERLCRLEKLDSDSTILLKTAAVFHDTGFIEQYDKNEPIGARLAGEHLPQFGYTPEQIATIQQLILSTASPRQPDGIMQKIICDADLDYTGRADFFTISQSLRREWAEHGRNIKLTEWYELEKDFLENHFFYTETAYSLRNKGKLENLDDIRQLLKDIGQASGSTVVPESVFLNLADDRLHLVELLNKTSLFKTGDRSLLERIAMMVERLHLKAEEPLFKKGDPGDCMYIIEKGSLKVHDEGIQLAELKAGEYFGEASLIDSAPRTASVSAKTDVIILRLGEKDFFSLLGSHPYMNRLLMKELINRLRNQNDNVVNEFRGREKKLQELVELRTMQIMEEKRNVEIKSMELELALKELQEAQRLLVHQEKMASLGQLTTGIAHELLNPLNFVNNFSSVSIDLLEEMKGSITDEDSLELCSDLLDNIKRISQHGHRAGEIVRSMAEHSSAFGKEKQEVNLHALIEDAVGVSTKVVEGTLTDEQVKSILKLEASHYKTEAVYSDLFRIFVNLLRNSVAAIHDRKSKGNPDEGVISVITQNIDGAIQIEVIDNGIGIPDEHVEKIFLPFFTTRPPGKGVGLGLSISHQIITAYGGQLLYEKDKDGTKFKVILPLG